jgi:hypothetical protein
MIKNLSKLMVVALCFALVACGGEEEKEGEEGEKKEAKAIEVSAEMADFNSLCLGTYKDVEVALEKYAASDELKEDDMGIYDLKDPKVVGKDGDCYKVDYTAGMTIHTFTLCWEGGKVVSIEDNGIK